MSSSIPLNTNFGPNFTISKGRLHISGIDDPKGISIVSSLNGWIQEKAGYATQKFKLPSGKIVRVNIKSMHNYLNRLHVPQQIIKDRFHQKTFVDQYIQISNKKLILPASTTLATTALKQRIINQLAKPLNERESKIAAIYQSDGKGIENLEKDYRFMKRNLEYSCNKARLVDKIASSPRTIALQYERKSNKIHEKLCPRMENQKTQQLSDFSSEGIAFSPLAPLYRSIQRKQRAASFKTELEQACNYEKRRSAEKIESSSALKHFISKFLPISTEKTKSLSALEHHILKFLPIMDQIKKNLQIEP